VSGVAQQTKAGAGNAGASGVGLSPVKRALQEILELRARLAAAEDAASAAWRQPLAIVGAGLRFPGGVADARSFWDLLAEGRDVITTIPQDRWDWRLYFNSSADAPGAMYSVRGGYLEGMGGFDAGFFGIAPREAAMLDPQQRLLLETAWHALEDAAIRPGLLRSSRTGIFVGLSNFDYFRAVLEDDLRIDAYAGSGNSPSMAAGRLAYILGARGPAITVDTSCSSSLTAVHLACQSLRAGECDLALAGGVNVILAPQMHIGFSRAHMLAPDGRCKTFDEAADGYVRSEGCAVVALRRLKDALAAGDRVLAVVRGSALNHDGRSAGLTAPSREAQVELLRDAYRTAGIPPSQVGMIEAHGTGTSLGDPIEMEALGEVFAGRPAGLSPIVVGSVKTNLGHTEAASGIAGLLKTVLSLQRRKIPRHLNLENKSGLILWADLPFHVPLEAMEWELEAGQRRRVAGVSSFGFSGSNAHVVLEEFVREEPAVPAGEDEPQAVTLSAKSPDALTAAETALAAYLREEDGDSLRDVCHTLSRGRMHHPHRRAFVVSTSAELLTRLNCEAVPGAGAQPSDPVLCFLFAGQGSERPGMGSELLDRSDTFRSAVDRAEAALQGRPGKGLREIWANANREQERPSLLQPALFAYGWALSELWRSWNVQPRVVLGHGLGDCLAATVAGVMTPEEGIRLVAAYGVLMDELAAPGGHLPALDGLLDAFEDEAATIAFRIPGIPWISNLTGRPVELDSPVGPRYWRQQLRHTVPFAPALCAAREMEASVFLEIGAGPQLSAFAGNRGIEAGMCIPSMGHGVERGEWYSLLTAASQLYTQGACLDWDAVAGHRPYTKVALPGYPFQRERFWFNDGLQQEAETGAAMAQAAAVQAAMIPVGLPVAHIGPGLDALNRWAAALMLTTLRELGCFEGSGDRIHAHALVARQGVVPVHGRLMERWLERLAHEGLLKRVEEGGNPAYSLAPDALSTAEGRARLESIWTETEQLGDEPLRRYLANCAACLPCVLRGELNPLETLFPGGGEELAQALYEQSPAAEYVNRIAAAAVAARARLPVQTAMGFPRRLRILEVGAGTGATTAAVLAQLHPQRVMYTFSDVSEVFLARARHRFRKHPVEFMLFDLDGTGTAAAHQGRYDVVLAANALHAAKDLRLSLAHLSDVLPPGGSLVLVETTTNHAWHDVSTGLIEGWQHVSDAARSHGSPLLPVERWAEELARAGFEGFSATPSAGEPTDRLGLHVLTAHKPSQAKSAGVDSARTSAAFEIALSLAASGRGLKSDGADPSRPAITSGALVEEIVAASPGQRISLAVQAVATAVAQVLGRSALPGKDERLMDLGLDSLMAIELRDRLEITFGIARLPSTLIFDYPTSAAIAKFLLPELGCTPGARGPEGPKEDADGDRGSAPQSVAAVHSEDELDRMSNEEVAELLREQLERQR
jgi:acyl transferase domain-containing protein/SAM-dependent methyltransferase/acyl carrier protein